MSEPQQFKPVLQPQTGFKVKIPNTPEGLEFLDRLKRLLNVEELRFEKVCSKEHLPPPTPPGAVGAPVTKGSGTTTYALDLRLEQEGWAP